MTDFDKLIKEKAEQAEYTYKPSAWKRFQRKTGHTATRYWVTGLSSVVLVGGVVAFFGHRMNQSAPEGDAVQTTPVVDSVRCQPTAAATTTAASDTFQVVRPAVPVPVGKRPSVQEKPAPEPPAAPTAEPQAAQPSPKVNKTPRYGRPLVIDVDTIKENVPTDEELRKGNSRLF